MYPIFFQMGKKILGWQGDNIQYVYMTGWVARAISTGQSPFVDPHLNYPGELLLTATDAPFLSMIGVTPISLVNPILGYNSIIFLSGILSGFFTYLWLKKLTRNHWAGLISGAVFCLSPYRITHSYGHLQLVSTHFIPLFFWSLDNALQGDKPLARQLSWLGMVTFLLGFGTSQYYLVICLLSGLIYALLIHKPRYFLKYGIGFVLTIGTGAFFSSLPYLITALDNLYQPYRISEVRIWSASLFDFMVPSRLHPIWGEFIEQLYPRNTWIEHTLYLGSAASILALLGLFTASTNNKSRKWIWFGIALLGLVVALGTDLHINGTPIEKKQPFWLPAYYLAHLPFTNLMRTWARFTILPIFFISALAGLGTDVLIKKTHKYKLLAIGLLILIGLDFAPGRIEAIELQYRPIDQWLAAQPGDFAVAFIPAGVENYSAMYGSLLHGKRIPAFNHPTHIPIEFKEYIKISEQFPKPEALQELRRLNFRYIIVERSSFNLDDSNERKILEEILPDTHDLQLVDTVGEYIILSWKSNQE